MRKSLVLLMALCLLLIVVPAAGAESEARPFKGSMSGSISFAPDKTCATLLRTDSQATGNVSHLGRATMTSAHCTPGAGWIEGGDLILVAANGDRVFITYEGAAPPPNADGIIVADIDFIITGGDGRFEGASGGGDMTGLIVFEGLSDPEWAASWNWSGTIGY